MQTFLPFADFTQSAVVLDRARLGKQRVENLQIMKALVIPGSGWGNHPAVKMWGGHEYSLWEYHVEIVLEWLRRGYKDTCLEKMEDLMLLTRPSLDIEPPWLGDPAFHTAHQSNLIRKKPEHYGPLFPDVSDDLPYVWPV